MTENNPNNKSLSIRVCTNGLSFCSYTPLADTPFEYKVFDIKPTISLAANIKEALTTEPMLKEEYQRVNVLITTPHFTTVPIAYFKLEDAQKYYDMPDGSTQEMYYNGPVQCKYDPNKKCDSCGRCLQEKWEKEQ